MNTTPDPAVAADRIGAELRTLSDRVAAVSSDFAEFASSLPTREPEPTRPPAAAPAAPAKPAAAQPTAAPAQPHSAAPHPPQPYVQYATGGQWPYTPPPTAPHWQANPWQGNQWRGNQWQGNQWQGNQWQTATRGAAGPATAHPAATRPAPAPSLSDRLAAATDRGLVGKILAAVGVAITLIGVVLLLVLAAQAGILRPEVRVAGGALLAAALVAVGARIGHRDEKRSGAAALIATGTAAALFDVLAAASIYQWLPEAAALALGSLIAGGGLWFAHRWDSQTLGLLVSVPLLVFAPIVTGGVDLVLIAFMPAYAAVTLWIQIGRDWTPLFAVNTAAATIPLLAATTTDDVAAWFLAPAIAVNIVLAVVSATLLLSTSSTRVVVGLVSVASGIPVFATPAMFDTPLPSVVAGIAALVFAFAAVVTRGRSGIGFTARIGWAVAAAIGFALSVLFAVGPDAQAPGALAVAIVILAVSIVAGDLRRALVTAGTVATGFGLLSVVASGALPQLFFFDGLTDGQRITVLIGVAFGIVAVTLLTWVWSAEAPDAADRLWIVGALVDLWLVTQLCVAVAAVATDGSGQGFRTGHTVATVIWFASAAAALMWARRNDGVMRTVALSAGLTLIAAAIAKLFLFDLAALDGFLRVTAFLVAGILLLGLGVAYAQRLTRSEPNTPSPAPHPAADTPH
ncbi:DUF2339 domain-containing protein [Gordonia shandongensis]|uniref:DUF2339 domain-containing protein n=1 Tax=Gordonia shandongensis TaxID=376351 RepID=UPI00041C7254|nr:DUF2339 domain-containing protein [Gordonia shandongensis]